MKRYYRDVLIVVEEKPCSTGWAKEYKTLRQTFETLKAAKQFIDARLDGAA